MDPLLKIATFNSIPNQEYALYGSVLESQVDTLLHRLKGLCGTLPGNGDPFEDHYISYSFKHVSPPIVVRTARSLIQNVVPWKFQYYGTEQSDSNRSVTQRQIIDACCSVKIPTFLQEGLGFQMDFEYIMKGYSFAKNRVKISVGRVYTAPRDASGSSVLAGEPVSGSYLVEVSTVAFGGNTDEPSDKDVIQFAEQLKSIVKLERFDPKRLPA
ncbi:putative Mediator of RNA polymerase II transcription subunit 18 [Hypsibius exemplaris]|uniref:Mediator of RNA polymerase II transcription subunit 18 n=1 Tax=Hypsibius exemplaris TaxID=2072580 RepID=A0A1W0X2Z4_HYPEX|nr:putative Mediator of RNA polymerase II transcription subunit 18 [Hypsibius exemplaris]